MKNIYQNTNIHRLNGLFIKAHNDVTFKVNLLAKPKETIESELNVSIDMVQGSKIVVDDQSNTDIIYLNIPRQIDSLDLNLTEQELEEISGGDGGITIFTVVCAVAAGAYIVDQFTKGWNEIPTAK